MAYLIFVVVLASICFVHASDSNDLCNCTGPEKKDNDLLWTLFKKLSADFPPDEVEINSVLPGELSPLIDCNCDENTRRKRKVAEPEVPAEVPVYRPLDVAASIDEDCPLDHIRIGTVCVYKDLLADYE